jgi:hypothetical protein
VTVWFRRFGEIPGIRFEASSSVNPRMLPGHDAIPTRHVFDFEGRRRETLLWPGGGSASPAHERAFGDLSKVASADMLRNVYEGLELPGQPSDYHFLIQGSAQELWGRRKREAAVLSEVEKLCWLDLQLIEACPDTIRYERGDEQQFFRVPTFAILTSLFEREGFLREALDVAERAARFGQGSDTRDRLLERIAALESEDRG